MCGKNKKKTMGEENNKDARRHKEHYTVKKEADA
jgi:hypothetical protein